MAALLGMVVAVAAVAAFWVSSSHPESPGSGPPTLVVAPEKTDTPFAAQTKIPETPTSTPEPTPTEALPGLGSFGKFETIDQLFENTDLTNAEKDAIRELTVGCTPEIITDMGLICIEDGLKTAPAQITLKDGVVVNMAQVHSIELDTVKFPDAIETFNRFIQEDKYNAWKNQSGREDVTYEQYLAEESQGIVHPFEADEYKGPMNPYEIHTLTGDAFMIYKFLADDTKTNRGISRSSLGRLEYSYEARGNVLATGIFMNNIPRINDPYRNGAPQHPHHAGGLLAGAAAYHGAKAPEFVLGYYDLISSDFYKVKPSLDSMANTLVPNWPEDTRNAPPPDADIDDIFIVKGTEKSK